MRLFCSDGKACLGVLATVLVFCGWTSLAGAQTIHTNHGPFDVDLNLGAHFQAEFSDNIDSSETHPRSDLQLRMGPYVGGTVGFDLPSHLSTGQRLSLTANMTYDARYSVADGTWDYQLGSPIGVSVILPFLVSGWDVNLSDTFTYTDDHLQTTFGFSQQNTVEYENTTGLSVGRRFGRYGLTLVGDRRDIWSPDDPTIPETGYDFSVIPSYYFHNGMSVFAKTTVGFVYPDDIARRNVISYIATAGISARSPRISPARSAPAGPSHSCRARRLSIRSARPRSHCPTTPSAAPR